MLAAPPAHQLGRAFFVGRTGRRFKPGRRACTPYFGWLDVTLIFDAFALGGCFDSLGYEFPVDEPIRDLHVPHESQMTAWQIQGRGT